jgi:ABC-type multidrug transport system fused ATPase/permease subunit
LKENEELEEKHMFTLIVRTFKGELITIILLCIVDGMLRMGISVIILYLFNAVADGETQMAYIYVGMIIVILYFSQLTKQTSFLNSYILASRIKSSLAMLLYARISSLTSYVIKSSQLGKITNLLASDLGVI